MKKLISTILVVFALTLTASAASLSESLYYGLPEVAEAMLQAEEVHGVPATRIAAVAALESGWGTSKLAETKNNLFGWRNNDGTYREFESKTDCIKYVARKISERGNWDGYSENPEWERTVTEIEGQIKSRMAEF